MRTLIATAIACMCSALTPIAYAQDAQGFAAAGDSESWTNMMLITDMGFHGGHKPGSGHTAPNGLTYSDIDDRSFNMRLSMASWPARAPFSEGATVFGQSVGFALELGVYGLFGGGNSEDNALRGGLTVDILYPLIQAQTFALVATFQGGMVGDSGYGGVVFGPGLQGLYQMGSLRFIAEYRYLPLWIGDNVITHDARGHVQFQLGDSFFLGVFGNLGWTQLREREAGYTRNLTALGLELGF
jgi:hypothetical protein